MNEHDSEKMSGVLTAEGMVKAGSPEDADLIIINTCSIREKAEQKFYSEVGKLRQLKADNPSLVIAVSGCIAQQEGAKILRRAPFVDLIFGNQNIKDLPGLIGSAGIDTKKAATDFADGYEHALLPAEREGAVSSFVNIMYGCDNFCSYCVVPYVRGREKSRKPEDIITEIEKLVESGCREVTLLGQNVNSYGRRLDTGCGFPELLKRLDKLAGLERIRFVTSHPRDLSDELIEAMAGLPKVCECLHLPVQSASDRMLEAMNRGYTFNDYMRKVEKLRNLMPDIALTTDIIVGFPGETDEDYEATVKALEDIRYEGIFSFKYSKRPNTKAVVMPGHLPEDVKAARLDRVIDLQNAITEENNKAMEESVVEVLVEGGDKTGGQGRLSGKSRGGKTVNFEGDLSLVGTLVKVKVTEGKKHSLSGKLVV